MNPSWDRNFTCLRHSKSMKAVTCQRLCEVCPVSLATQENPCDPFLDLPCPRQNAELLMGVNGGEGEVIALDRDGAQQATAAQADAEARPGTGPVGPGAGRSASSRKGASRTAPSSSARRSFASVRGASVAIATARCWIPGKSCPGAKASSALHRCRTNRTDRPQSANPTTAGGGPSRGSHPRRLAPRGRPWLRRTACRRSAWKAASPSP